MVEFLLSACVCVCVCGGGGVSVGVSVCMCVYVVGVSSFSVCTQVVVSSVCCWSSVWCMCVFV